MKIKCPECNKKIDKQSQYCSFCGYEIPKDSDVKSETITNEGYVINNKTAFLTDGSMFKIKGHVVILGFAVQNLNVGDILTFKTDKFKIKKIQISKNKEIQYLKNIKEGYCALYFKGINFAEFKTNILEECAKLSSHNRPIYFIGDTSTTSYAYLEFK